MRNSALTIAVAIAFSLNPASCKAVDTSAHYYHRASSLEELCNLEFKDTIFSSTEGVMQYCEGFISALADSYDRSEAKGGWRFCLPRSIVLEDIKKDFKIFLQRNRTKRSASAVSVLSHALEERYPCHPPVENEPRPKLPKRQLISHCKKTDEQGGAGFCYGYLQGTIEALDAWTKTNHARGFCRAPFKEEIIASPFSYLPNKTWDFIGLMVQYSKSDHAGGLTIDTLATEFVVFVLAKVLPCRCVTDRKVSRIYVGMTYSDIVRVLGCKCKDVLESLDHTRVYSWEDSANKGLYLRFRDDRLVEKLLD
jgi:hypothetical protein